MSAEDPRQAEADDVAEDESGEEEGVEQVEAKESLSDEEARLGDEQVLAELDELASRGEIEGREDLFEPVDEEGLTPAKVKLSAHFLLSEFHCKDAQRTPVPAAALPKLKRLVVDVLEPLRAQFGPCTVNSGFRTAAKNKQVDGKPKSWHRYDERGKRGVAADVKFQRGRPSEWADAAERLLPNGGLGRYRTFIHVDNRPGRARF